MTKSTCKFDGCPRSVHGRGLCGSHYKQELLGKPLAPLAPVNGSVDPKALFWAKVRKTESCWEWTGYTDHEYGIVRYQGAVRKAHRVSYVWAKGDIPEGLEIDHRCLNRRCVNPDHLRTVTRKQNRENLTGGHRGSKSGVRGVSWHEKSQKWLGIVTHHGIAYRLGSFSTVADAERAVVAKRLELFTHNELDRLAPREKELTS